MTANNIPFRDSVSQYIFGGVLICICHNVYQICNLEYTLCKIKNCKENINMSQGHFADRLQSNREGPMSGCEDFLSENSRL